MKVIGVCLLILSILLINVVVSDNPVLCTVSQVKGKWRFTFDTKPVKKGDYNFDRMSCGRGQPTKLAEYSSEPDEQAKHLAKIQGASGDNAETEDVIIKLTDDRNNLIVMDGEDSEQSLSSGTWTMTVHEGMIGFFKHPVTNKPIVFDTFFRYNLVEKSKPDYESICYETMVGWYHTVNPKDEADEDWGCFYAKKINPSEKDLNPENHIHFVNESPVFDNSKEMSSTCDSQIDIRGENGQLTWKTAEGMSSATDSNFAAFTPDFSNSKSEYSTSSVSRDNEGQLKKLGEAYKLLGRNPDQISIMELPQSLNWNNVGGYSFYPPIVNQACGDCYLVASLSVVESRIMIRTNGKLKPKLSNQMIKDCDFYIEGCDGGLPINVAKFAWEFRFIEEKCYKDTPLTQEQKDNGKVCKTDLLISEECENYRIDDFYYVGGNYGGVSEELIMKELVANGPVTAVLNAPPYLQKYKGCILEQECKNGPGEVAFIDETPKTSFLQIKTTTHMISSQSLWDRGIEWEMVNHSIVIIGYGIDDTCINTANPSFLQNRIMIDSQYEGPCDLSSFDGAYWIIANSWGEKFGENGFFRLRRGCNDFGIETQSLSMIPRITSEYLDSAFKK